MFAAFAEGDGNAVSSNAFFFDLRDMGLDLIDNVFKRFSDLSFWSWFDNCCRPSLSRRVFIEAGELLYGRRNIPVPEGNRGDPE